MLVRVIGLLLLVEAAFMTLPLITALFYHEKEITHLIISIGLTAGSGCIMMSIRPKSLEMGKREAILSYRPCMDNYVPFRHATIAFMRQPY